MHPAQPRRVKLEVEALEDRQLLAGSVALDPLSHALVVKGTPRNDKVIVSSAAGGTMITVAFSGKARVSRFSRDQVAGLDFDGNGGRDRLINRAGIPIIQDWLPGLTQQSNPTSHIPVSLNADQALILQATNNYRQVAGLGAVAADARLRQVAQAHAEIMASRDSYGDSNTNGHIVDGQDVVGRVAQVGYSWSVLGENVGYTWVSSNPAQAMIDAWWASPGHRSVMLTADFVHIGVGIARSASGRTFAVQVFATPG